MFCSYLSTDCTPEVVGMRPDVVDTNDSANVSAHALGTSEQSVFILDNLYAGVNFSHMCSQMHFECILVFKQLQEKTLLNPP